MSTVFIISIIIILLSILVCYAFISQTIKTKKEEKVRRTLMLKKRKNTFMFMLNGFPAGFLPPDMALLVQGSLIDTLEQLNMLDPSNTTHTQDLQIVSQKMTNARKEGNANQRVEMESHQQIKEVKACLQELNKFIHMKERLNEISAGRSDNLQAQIKQLDIHITIDGYELSGRTAKEVDKTQLAHHYYQLALNLLNRESKSPFKGEQAKKYITIIEQLKEQLLAEEPPTSSSPTATTATEKPDDNTSIENEEQWNTFTDTQDNWKKNNEYD